MPLYEYRCPQCQNRFEILQRMGDGAEGVRCPSCGAERVERQLSTFAAGGGNGGGGGAEAAGSGPGCGSGFT
jgi:putative FmdB family regulatory protein